MQSDSSAARPGERVELTLADFAARLEHRLHWADITEHQFLDGCSYAAAQGLHAVLCRPEHVELAVGALAGTEVRVVTGLAFHDQRAPVRSPGALATEAAHLVELGAHEVSLLAAPGIADGAGANRLLEQVDAVHGVVAPAGARVRVALNGEEMTDEQVSATCELLAGTGVQAVQGAAVRCRRIGVARVEVKRKALPRPIKLHWAHR